jgi:nucleotide-binding universal stress UspA family protein
MQESRKGGKILVAFDGSDSSKMAVRKAVEMAKGNGGSLTLLFVYWDPAERRSDLLMHETEDAEEDRGSRVFRDIEKELKASGVDYDTRVEQYSDIPKGILEIAQKEGFDMIALGTTGITGKAEGPVYQAIKSRSKLPLITP